MGGGYANFDVDIVGTPAGYAVRVLASPAGEASAPFVNPFAPVELARFINAVGPPRVASRRLVPLAGRVTEVRAYGQQLADALFAGDVGATFRESLAACVRDGSELRIRLRLEAVPDLDALPWEYLYDSELERFLTLSKKTPVVRVLSSADPAPPVTVHPPLRVLVMISSPSDLARLDVEREERLLRLTTEDLVASGLLELVVVADATLANLQRALLQDVHVFHFIGHGGFDEVTQEGVLALEREDHGAAHFVTGARLGTLLHDASSLQLAVLNACEGARTSSGDAFSGVGQALVRQGLPAVVAMQSEISDRAALDFSHQFYWFLTQGLGIEATLCEVRKAMAVSDEASEWGTPVLLRSETGQPFTVLSSPAARDEDGQLAAGPAPLSSAAADRRVASLYDAAVAALEAGRRDIARPLLEQVALEQPGHRDVQHLLDGLEDAGPAPQVPLRIAPDAVAPAPGPAPRSAAASTPAAPPTLGSRVRKVLLAVGTPSPPQVRRRRARGCLLSVVATVVVIVALVVWWNIRIGPYSDTCGRSITSSGDVAQPLIVPCALEVPRIDGQFDEWATGASHPMLVGADRGGAPGPRASWKARWDNAGLYVYAQVVDSTAGVDAVAGATAYPYVDGVTVLSGDSAQRLQVTDEARSGDVAVTMATTTQGVSSGRTTDDQLPVFTDAPEVLAQVARGADGYEVEARIPWATLGREKTPSANSVVALCLLATDGVGEETSARTSHGCPNWTGWDRLHPGAWQTAILSLDE
ncbi:CHAT domain-containing protein [Humibacillus xanthopallidus]|uniref:CHAT domain-containing protein n=1 Tax=Humibacillus xanthopallidus TaxID=412689 RepID=UPI00384EA72C